MSPIITTFVGLPAVAVCLLVAGFAPSASGSDPAKSPIVASFVGLDGGVLQPGKHIQISWTLKGKEVRDLEANPWSECELYFSPDGGTTWNRITPKLSVTTRSHGWTVPNVESKRGIIALQIGIEGEGEFYFFESSSFVIRALRRAD